MKLTKLANELLKYMVKTYSDTHQRCFMFDTFKSMYSELDDDFISDALYLLEDDGFVSVLSAENVAYYTTLLPNAIRTVEEDTLIKKGYDVLKEIRTLL